MQPPEDGNSRHAQRRLPKGQRPTFPTSPGSATPRMPHSGYYSSQHTPLPRGAGLRSACWESQSLLGRHVPPRLGLAPNMAPLGEGIQACSNGRPRSSLYARDGINKPKGHMGQPSQSAAVRLAYVTLTSGCANSHVAVVEPIRRNFSPHVTRTETCDWLLRCGGFLGDGKGAKYLQTD